MFRLGRLVLYLQTIDQAGRLAKDKHSIVVQKFVNYGQKKFHDIGPLCYRLQYMLLIFPKLLKIKNLWQLEIVIFLHKYFVQFQIYLICVLFLDLAH